MHAQRLLVERGANDVVPALCELVRDSSVDDIGLNVGAITPCGPSKVLARSGLRPPTRPAPPWVP